MWTNSFAYVGGKATGYKGGKFALVGPGWKGQLPKNVKRIDCPTPWILVQPRVHIFKNGKLSLEGARDILQQIRTIGLAKYNGKKPIASVNYLYPAPQFSDPNLPVSALSYKDPLQFWDLLSIALSENPPPTDQITALLPMFKSLGIEFGKPWDRSKVPPEVLAAMSDAAKNIGDMLSNLPMGTIYKGAFIPPPSIGNPKNDYKTRAIVARVGLTANIPEEAIYWIYTQDSQYQFLNGSHKYTMTFREGLPFYAPGFWSVTMYDSKNNYTVPNPLKRYMLGSDTPKIKKNADGSFTLYIQTQNPGKDKESNWLPAPPGQFYLIPRAYPPKPELIKVLTDVNAWPVPVVIQQAK
jgi:DNA sulfur modification protein DndE